MEQRTCGGCTACCKTHGVKTIEKMPGVWCEHCNIGHGCQIYSGRPESCRRFKCLWLSGRGGPLSRPDKVNVVALACLIPELEMVALSLWEVKDGALNSDFVRSWTLRNVLSGTLVMHYSTSGKCTLYGNEKIEEPIPTLTMDGEKLDLQFISFQQTVFELRR